jgi:hypothetical protein
VGGFLGIGGINSKQQNQSMGNLNNLFNFGFGAGKNLTSAGNSSIGAGEGNLGAAGNYFSQIASGNRTALTQAAAPVANSIQSQGDAARRQQASQGTARGGGVASTNQTQKDSQMAQVDNALFGARGDAAKEEGQIGSQQSQIGLGQLGAGANLLNTGTTASGYEGDIATKARQQAAQEQASAIQSVVGAIFG